MVRLRRQIAKNDEERQALEQEQSNWGSRLPPLSLQPSVLVWSRESCDSPVFWQDQAGDVDCTSKVLALNLNKVEQSNVTPAH